MLVAPELLRLLIEGDRHPVALPALVLPPLELADDEVGLHLQRRHAAVEVLVAVFAKARCRLQFIAGMHSAVLADIHDRFIAALYQLVVPGRVKIIPVPARIGKAREPLPGNEPGPSAEELSVSNFPGRRDDLPPDPGVLLGIAGPPEKRRDVLLRGKARHLVGKQRQETDFIDPVDQLAPGTDPVRVIPVQSFHDPFASFIGHSAAPPLRDRFLSYL